MTAEEFEHVGPTIEACVCCTVCHADAGVFRGTPKTQAVDRQKVAASFRLKPTPAAAVDGRTAQR